MKFTSPVFATASGSIAGTTFGHNRSGLYVRARTRPVNPRSTRQSTVRALFATLITVWNNELSGSERTAWETWSSNTPIVGKDGNPINISGLNAFTRFNTIRLQIGQARVDAAPTIFNNGNPITSTDGRFSSRINDLPIMAATSRLSLRVRISGRTSDTGDAALFIGRPVNASRTFFKGPYQFAATGVAFADVAIVDFITTFADLQNNNDALVVSQVRPIRLRMVYDDGRLSESFSILADVVEDV